MAVSTGKDKMEPRLLSLLSNNGASEATMDTLGTAGLVKFTVFSHLASSRDKLCEFLAKPPLSISTETFDGVIEQAKIVAAWEAGKIMRDCEPSATPNVWP